MSIPFVSHEHSTTYTVVNHVLLRIRVPQLELISAQGEIIGHEAPADLDHGGVGEELALHVRPLQNARVFDVVQVLRRPILHAQEHLFDDVEAEDGEPLEEQAGRLLREAEGTDQFEGRLHGVQEREGVALQEVGQDLQVEDEVLLEWLPEDREEFPPHLQHSTRLLQQRVEEEHDVLRQKVSVLF